jgi:hypothetical protein
LIDNYQLSFFTLKSVQLVSPSCPFVAFPSSIALAKEEAKTEAFGDGGSVVKNPLKSLQKNRFSVKN